MNRLTDIRLHAQQLVAPQFDDPAELIRWMGMVQAQEYSSAKWAVALRLRTPAAAPVEEAAAGWTRGTTCVAAGCWNGYSEGATTSRGSRSQGSWNEPEWPSTHRG